LEIEQKIVINDEIFFFQIFDSNGLFLMNSGGLRNAAVNRKLNRTRSRQGNRSIRAKTYHLMTY